MLLSNPAPTKLYLMMLALELEDRGNKPKSGGIAAPPEILGKIAT